MEIHEQMLLELDLLNPDGSVRRENMIFRYSYTSGQPLNEGSINVNAFDLAELVERSGAQNFEYLGIKLQVNLTLQNGEEEIEKIGEVVLPELIMKASPAQLREMGNQSGDQSS